MQFEFDETKRLENIHKHGIDFKRIQDVFAGRVDYGRSDRSGETRWLTLVEINLTVIAVVYTMRGDVTRIISARKARDYERRAYRDLLGPVE